MFKKLPVYLGILSILTIIIIYAGFTFYRNIIETERNEAYSNISTLAKLKIDQMLNWKSERISDGDYIQHNALIFKELKQLFMQPNHISARKNSAVLLESIRNNHEYLDIIVITPDYRTVSLYASDYTLHYRDSIYLEMSLREKRIILAGIHRDLSSNQISMGTYIPIMDTIKKDVFGYIKILMDPTKHLFPMIQAVPLNSRTAETFLVRQDGDSVTFLNNLKFRNNSALNYRLPVTMKDLPAVMAVMGKSGIVEGIDYTGSKVLADLRPVPDSPWFIVSKINVDEVYAPARQRSLIGFAAMILLIIICGLLLYLSWKNQRIKYLNTQIELRESLRKSEQRFRKMFENHAAVMLIIDPENGQILDANPSAVEFYGYTYNVLTSMSIQQINQLSREEISAEMKNAAEKRRNHHIFPHRLSSGDIRIVEVYSSPLNVDDKQLLFSIIQDITSRKFAENALRDTLQELQRSNKDLEHFAYSASHDLQEPIRMVKSYAQLFKLKYENTLDEDARTYLDFMNEGASRMEALINSLLRYSRISTQRYEFEKADFNELIKDTLDDLSFKINEENAVVEYNDLPELYCNPTLIRQLFLNLIHNALKFRSEKQPEIKISCIRKNEYWLFSVEDNGIGIEPAYFEKIFLIFQRLHDREKYPGTGIGLAICKKIVERHGGQICVDSTPGRGTVFFFTLPVAGAQHGISV